MGIETKRIMKKYLYLVLGFYFLLHVAKIEVFPLYHFGMYSQYVPYKESPFVSYDVYIDEVKQNFSKEDYRKHTYLMNTIQKYDEISANDFEDSEAEIIRKYLNFIGIKKDEQSLKTYSYPNLETDMLAWLSRYFKCRNSQNVIIEKSTYRFGKNQEIKLQNKQIILPQ